MPNSARANAGLFFLQRAPRKIPLAKFGFSEVSSLREQTENKMKQEDRFVLVLVNESRRMRESAERVDLVVRALALKRGVHCPVIDPGKIADQDTDLL